MPQPLYFLLMLFCFVSVAPAQNAGSAQADMAARAWIAQKVTDDAVIINGMYDHGRHTDADLSYEMITFRHGASGTVQSAKSGRFHAAPATQRKLSNTKISVTAGDRYTIVLEVRRNAQIVAADSVRVYLQTDDSQ